MNEAGKKTLPGDEAFPLLDAYVDQLQAGQGPDRDKLLAEHADLAVVLDCLEVLEQLAPPPLEGPVDSQATTAWQGDAGRAQSPPTEQAPVAFGKYELLGEIGRGGMGVVYKARQKDLNRLVAIKMILAGRLASADQVRRFHSEARTAAGLHHPHIVRIHEAGELNGQHYFAMEYVAGSGLDELLRKGPLPIDAAARHLAVVARAVAHLHAHGIVHRDLKPSNILVDENGRPCVTDFGLAKMLGESNLTNTGAVLGTPSYMAPEQAAGKGRDVGPPSDVWSLGAILYELLTGQAPFVADNPLDVLVLVLESEPAPPSQLHPRVPRELELVCLKCLDKEPENRYPSAAELANDLERFLHGEPVEARPHSILQHLARWGRREPALASRLAALGLCAVIVQANYHVHGTADAGLHYQVMAVLAAWVLGSAVCQRLLRRGQGADGVRLAWVGLDMACLTLALYLDDSLPGLLFVGFPVLIGASGLWFRVRLVWATTLLAEAGFAILAMESFRRRGLGEESHHAIVFGVGLAVLGFLVAYQVRRVRALSHYYAQRPLP